MCIRYSLVSLRKTARLVNCECSAFDDLEVLTPRNTPPSISKTPAAPYPQLSPSPQLCPATPPRSSSPLPLSSRDPESPPISIPCPLLCNLRTPSALRWSILPPAAPSGTTLFRPILLRCPLKPPKPKKAKANPLSLSFVYFGPPQLSASPPWSKSFFHQPTISVKFFSINQLPGPSTLTLHQVISLGVHLSSKHKITNYHYHEFKSYTCQIKSISSYLTSKLQILTHAFLNLRKGHFSINPYSLVVNFLFTIFLIILYINSHSSFHCFDNNHFHYYNIGKGRGMRIKPVNCSKIDLSINRSEKVIGKEQTCFTMGAFVR
ncbi:hypothetical protein VP01_2077g2 [Puccinia sorghi]|uniref:Uncharacterized protein n=1 Tax=Puccinia sorghi TaxID=27349 RepID=A0A0L6VAM7_9BASI|nr:hypothetical protein VP01_2077g2 [Puccinia sorghi]